MSSRMEQVVQQGLPWRRGIPWWLVLVEGILVLGIGLFLAFQPDSARSTIRGLIGLFLIFNSLLGIVSGLRPATRNQPMAPYRLLRGGIGLFAGLMVVLQPVFEYVDADATRTILAVGLTLWGLIGLYAAFATHDEGGFRWNTIVLSGLSIVFAVMLFRTSSSDNPFVEPAGYVAIIVGLILLAYAYVLYRSTTTAIPDQTAPQANAP
jgi:uncharacterized membrane protein HdeD (DUF308 family)